MSDPQSQSLPDTTPDGKPILHVCHGRMCGRQAKFIMDRVTQVQQKGVAVEARSCTCLGLCDKGPNVKYKGKIHHRMNPITVSNLVKGK